MYNDLSSELIQDSGDENTSIIQSNTPWVYTPSALHASNIAKNTCPKDTYWTFISEQGSSLAEQGSSLANIDWTFKPSEQNNRHLPVLNGNPAPGLNGNSAPGSNLANTDWTFKPSVQNHRHLPVLNDNPAPRVGEKRKSFKGKSSSPPRKKSAQSVNSIVSNNNNTFFRSETQQTKQNSPSPSPSVNDDWTSISWKASETNIDDLFPRLDDGDFDYKLKDLLPSH